MIPQREGLPVAAVGEAGEGGIGAPGCNAPLSSSHHVLLFGPIFERAQVLERLMRSLFVVPADPRPDLLFGLGEAREVVEPDAFLLQAAEEPLHDPILLRYPAPLVRAATDKTGDNAPGRWRMANEIPDDVRRRRRTRLVGELSDVDRNRQVAKRNSGSS